MGLWGATDRSSPRATARLLCSAAIAAAVLAPAASAHELDHPAAAFAPSAPLSSTFNSGGEGARWELLTTIPTGNPHTDLDFFTRGGETFASVGTLAIGPNSGGQTIVQLTSDGGDRVDPRIVGAHPSASCISRPDAALGLQHDVEATPKGGTILNTRNPFAPGGEARLILDATDQRGRCHDQSPGGISGSPRGGLEIIDVTDPANPVEIGLTSHIGESHTVNIDPKRPHIAYTVTSDMVNVNPEDGTRSNPESDRFNLDGFEVVDFSSCLYQPAGLSVEEKRKRCDPVVYRFQYPSGTIAQGHTKDDWIGGCHELEVYPSDLLTCASITALVVFDMNGAFDDGGTPTDFTDDHPIGTPLPCDRRASASNTPAFVGAPTPFATGAMVEDCVNDPRPRADEPGETERSDDLDIPGWEEIGSPSLEGVRHLGSVYHQGRPASGEISTFDSTEDIDIDHEAELTASGNFLIATDERGGGVLPPQASCTRGEDNKLGNGGVQFFRYGGLSTTRPSSAAEAHQAYARTPSGEKAIFRAPINTKPQGTVCTAHVFQQIPGQNRIFMGWYSQGTQVIDFVENPDGTVRFKRAGWFIPEHANEWVSHIFKMERNRDGTFTYWGATGDFDLGEAGRNAIDVYKVTLPPAPRAATSSGPGQDRGDIPPPDGSTGPGDPPVNPGGTAGPCQQRVRGGKGKERLIGSIAGDRINGGGGGDRIRGRSGDDCLRGEGGRDRLKGEAGQDRVRGGKQGDRLRGGTGADVLRDRASRKDRFGAGPGDDRVVARRGGRDVVRCGPGTDRALVDKRDRVRGCEQVRGD